MSTKMSTELNITRPSTKLHAPPGGASSFSLGNLPPAPPAESEASKKAAAAAVKAAEPEPPVAEVQNISVSAQQTIGLIVAGEVGVDVTIEAVTKALLLKGINQQAIAVTQCEDVMVLPYLVKRVVKHSNFKVIIAAAVLTSQGNLQSFLIDSLMGFGVESSVPIIPAVVKLESLLEVKALVPKQAESWARSAALLLGSSTNFQAAPAVVLPPQAPATIENVNDLDTLMLHLRESLKKRGATGIFGLARKFKIADDDNSGHISLAEFTKCMNEHKLGWNAAQIKIVFDSFDKDKSGGINFDEFLIGVRGGLSDRRKQFVLMAYEILDADKSGVVELNDIMAKYDGTKHPDVIAGKRTNEEVLREFMSTFDTNSDGKITLEEFLEYYSNLSASIDTDDYFELMMRNAWHISGGEGWCANSSCRRVLVIHNDGRQTVEEIKNDLGMKPNDKEAMIANLKAQGISDIKSIDTSGSTDGPSEPAAAAPAVAAAPAAPANKRRAPGGSSSLVLG